LFEAVALKSEYGPKYGFQLRIFSARSRFRGMPLTGHQRPNVALAIVPGQVKRDFGLGMRKQLPDTGFVLSKSISVDSQRPAVEGAVVNQAQVDFDRLGAWLRYCDGLHQESCGLRRNARGLSVPLKCIDCVSREILQIHGHVDYFALSYVWGTSASASCNNEESRNASLPLKGVSQVITDAMAVVIALGKQYLWVDQYCVEQHEHTVRNVQVQEMDKIYAGAYATIVACAGSNADYGLPGVSRARSWRQTSATTAEYELLSTLPSFSYAIKDTVWITRGWTYQEAILSRRCLFFTELQVYLTCLETECSEAVAVQSTSERRKINVERGSGMLNAEIFQGSHRNMDGPLLRKFADHVKEYSGRSFKYDSDILNALRGLLTRLPFYTYYGIPIARYDEPRQLQSKDCFNIGFARGLFWLPKYISNISATRTSLSRRTGFPSWSWVGWKGQVDYCSNYGPHGIDNGQFMKIDTNRFDTKFWVENTDMRLFELEELANSLNDSRLIPELSPYLVIDAKTFRFRFQPTARKDMTVCVCRCHYDSLHQGVLDHAGIWDCAIFFAQPNEVNDYYYRMINETWDCVLLYEDAITSIRNLIIIEWIQGVAYQVGVLPLRDPSDTLISVPFRRQRIRLG
jgi:hypothetical protein